MLLLRDVMTEQPGVARAFTYQHDGLTLAYAVVGDGPQPILFVHGATATGEFEWADLAAALGPGYRCILPDLRGHGRSEFRPTATTGDAVRADLRYLIEPPGPGPPAYRGFLLRRGDRADAGAGQPGNGPISGPHFSRGRDAPATTALRGWSICTAPGLSRCDACTRPTMGPSTGATWSRRCTRTACLGPN